MKINIRLAFLSCITLSYGAWVMAGQATPLVIAQSTPTPTPTPKTTSTSSPKPISTSTPKPTPTSTLKSTPTPTPKTTVTPTPSPTSPSTPGASPTPTPQATNVPLSEKASYIGTCRSTGAESLKVYADAAQTQLVSDLPAFSKVTLTGVLGQGIVQISQPSVGWIKTTTLLTNCDARPKTP